MSLIKAIKAQLGLSNTPANNFTLDASADNGTLKLARGNAGATTQDILTVNAAGKVAFPQNIQTWQDVTGSRALSTDYTNTTGQPIQVSVGVYNTVASGTFDANLYVAGLIVSTVSKIASGGVGYDMFSVVGTVPAGATYRCQGTQLAITRWMELR